LEVESLELALGPLGVRWLGGRWTVHGVLSAIASVRVRRRRAHKHAWSRGSCQLLIAGSAEPRRRARCGTRARPPSHARWAQIDTILDLGVLKLAL